MHLLIAAFTIAIGSAWTSLAAEPRDRVVAAHYPPLMVAGDTEYPGYAIEIMREAARRAGRSVDITFLPFERAIFELQNTPGTLMPALFRGKERDDLFLWVVDINVAELRFASTTGRIDDLDTARALKSIVVETGTTGEILLNRRAFENVIRMHDPAASARMLESGRVEAWFLTKSNMQRVWSALDASPALIFGDIIHSVPISMVASTDLPDDVTAAYRTAVQSMYDDGTLTGILERYEAN
ncbi:transporter substrate-binding domain-containing protein [uncultured Tateyamaria sp.]|uniref:substrate-binding periplasmic protein n=1 Tax=Tateyamaria sp. 1078 TaxID=3417464 RepID=UPI0026076576|nr:transporter substrate-binding domain-containing protein [uncultured Tateyamaria sp.]